MPDTNTSFTTAAPPSPRAPGRTAHRGADATGAPDRAPTSTPWTLRKIALVAFITVDCVLGLVAGGWIAVALTGQSSGQWVLGRAAGLTSYLLLVTLVLMGLTLAHPWRTKFERPSRANRIRVHVSLAVFTLVFTALHILVLATDDYAGVGWSGALLPLGSQYRPLPVTMGVLGLYAGLLAGITAIFATGISRRVWWPIHRVSIVAMALVWLHAVFAGSDSTALMLWYVATGMLVIGVAISRYTAQTPADLAAAAGAAARPTRPAPNTSRRPS